MSKILVCLERGNRTSSGNLSYFLFFLERSVISLIVWHTIFLNSFPWGKTFMTLELQDIYFFIVTPLYPLIVGAEGFVARNRTQ